MALRLILVGVVASLALDLPRGDVRPVATRAIRSVLVAEPCRRAPDASRVPALAAEPTQAQTNLPIVAEVTAKPSAPVATVEPTVTVEPSLPAAASEETATVVAPSPLPAELALLPTSDAASAPMTMPPAPEVASAPISPIVEPVASPAPIPTTVAVAPMSPPSPVAEEMSPESAPAPAPAVAETEKTAPVDLDAAFRKVVASMASTFAADLPAATPATESKPLIARVEAAPAPAPAPTPAPAAPAPALAAEEVGEFTEADLYPGVAFALNREAEGIATEEATARPEPSPAPIPSAEPSRAERLSEAVKLTGQAVNAWAGLLSQRTPSSAIQR